MLDCAGAPGSDCGVGSGIGGVVDARERDRRLVCEDAVVAAVFADDNNDNGNHNNDNDDDDDDSDDDRDHDDDYVDTFGAISQ
ncbi:hypothetical protein HZH66_010334 [Vespula vulgaris]|uniref:Uncharacterized protein n=1 Tax=Vespula vulgaris TaxID=7454 RepID=A0A834JJR1_VESVU|nr:hypothetical protein HZH66_010334 [Vespula vulgaris]